MRRGIDCLLTMENHDRNTVLFDWQNSVIPESETKITATRSSGPGGQGVNTTSSKVEVRWNIGISRSLSEEQKQKVRDVLRNRINRNDELVITSETERSQRQNKKEALDKLTTLIRNALMPEEERIPTHKSTGVKAKERRLKEIKKRKKTGRSRVNDW
jgi:ribosome-associated protein